jgi:putative phage-type endonuclease
MLTASDVASAIGENFFKSRDVLLLEKCGFKKFYGNENTERGTVLEPMVRDLYDKTTNRKTHEIGLLAHEDHPWLGGSVDGITEDNLLIEIKCPNKIKKSIPKHYIPQIQLLLEITQLTECDFVQYCNGDMHIIRTQKDPEWFPKYLPLMREFWEMVIDAKKNGLCKIITCAPPELPPISSLVQKTCTQPLNDHELHSPETTV